METTTMELVIKDLEDKLRVCLEREYEYRKKVDELEAQILKMRSEFNCPYFANECAGKVTEGTVCPCEKWEMKK